MKLPGSCNASNVMYQQHSGKFYTTYWLERKSEVLNISAFYMVIKLQLQLFFYSSH